MVIRIIIHVIFSAAMITLGLLMTEYPYSIYRGDLHILQENPVAVFGIVLVVGGIFYGAVSVFLAIYLSGKLQLLASNTIKNIGKKNAYTELTKLKKLLDEGILSQEEYDKRSTELKVKVL